MLPGAKIVALRRETPAGRVDDGVSASVSTLSDALAFRPQVAVIATPSTHHIEAAAPLAQSGAHLLVEKPIAAAVEGVPEFIDLCRANGVTLMTGYNLRFAPALLAFRRLLLESRIGRVLSVRAEVGQHLPSWRPATDYRDSVSGKSALGGGVLLELSHEIDFLRWLFGDIAWVSAVALRQSALEIDVEDTAHLLLGFAPRDEGAALVGSLIMDFIRKDATRTCLAIGDRGSLRWNALAGTVELFEEGAPGWTQCHASSNDVENSYRAEWTHFLECVSSGRPPLVAGEDGLAVIRVIEAARRSSAERRVITLPGAS